MAYWRYVEPQSTTHCAKRQAEWAWRLPRFSQGGAPNVTIAHALRRTEEARNVCAERGRADRVAGG